MLIVSDTSPLNLLVQIRQIDLLPALFDEIVIPPEVAQEMAHAKAPKAVRSFINAPPQWLSVRSPLKIIALPSLDLGEIAAISLAIELDAPLLMDERDGRVAAQAYGLSVVGAVGILEQAANKGLIPDLAAVHAAIRTLPFHVADKLLDASLARHLSRRPPI